MILLIASIFFFNNHSKGESVSLTLKKCVPCEGGAQPFSFDAAHNLLKDVSVKWALTCPEKEQKTSHGCSLSQTFKFKNFEQSMTFVNQVAELAESEGHHPDILIQWNKVTLSLTTHAIDGLSENDFIIAAKIDALN